MDIMTTSKVYELVKPITKSDIHVEKMLTLMPEARGLRNVRVLPGPKDRVGWCSMSVQQKVIQFGGELIYGIMLYHVSDLAIRGIRHAIFLSNCLAQMRMSCSGERVYGLLM